MIKLLRGGDCWRVRKSLQLIRAIFCDNINSDFMVTTDFFDALASKLSQPIRSSHEDEETNWVYLIVKNQDKAIDHGISRLINSFLYSPQGKCGMICDALNIMSTFVNIDSPVKNIIRCLKAPFIPKAFVNILTEFKDHIEPIGVCLELIGALLTSENDELVEELMELEPESDGLHILCSGLVNSGICEALVTIMQKYSYNEHMRDKVINLILHIVRQRDYISYRSFKKFLRAGLMRALLPLFKKQTPTDILGDLISYLYQQKFLSERQLKGMGYRYGVIS
jgi:hypothetical protein